MRIAIAGGTGTVGRHVVDVARERAHTPIVLTRSGGVDLVSGTGLTDAVAGTDCVIDVASVQTRSGVKSAEFFRAESSNLLRTEHAAGVPHHIALGIVGSLDAPYDYYAGKKVQEELVETGPVPWTILRATQFHEFASQLLGIVTLGPISIAPIMRSQPVAAREVAERLIELAEAGPSGRVPDLAGPRVESMVDLVRRYARAVGALGPIVGIPLPGPGGRAMRDGTLLATPGATIGRQTFAEWLDSVAARQEVRPRARP